MNAGIITIAHNSQELDYASMALFSAMLAKKNLSKPVSLITDDFTVDEMIKNKIYDKATDIFDTIIVVEREENNFRNINQKDKSVSVPFLNYDRCNVFDLSPYDRTLLIDCDLLVMSDNLNKYWNVDSSIMISPSISDLRRDRGGILDQVVSPQSIPLLWATTVMFSKDESAQCFFELVKNVKENYLYYSELYLFNPRMFRNDIAFSIAYHIWQGFISCKDYQLPPIKIALDKDEIYEFTNEYIKFFINNELNDQAVTMTKLINTDVHVMNKYNLIEIAKKNI
jgi:hypothetical protein